jgi:hypothetical protein
VLWQGPEAIALVNYRPILSSERAPHIKKPATVRQERNLVMRSTWGPDTKTDWPTYRRSQLNVNFNFNFYSSTETIRDLNLAAVTCTAVQVSRLSWQGDLLLAGHNLLY